MTSNEWGLLGVLGILAFLFCFGLGWAVVDAYIFVARRCDRAVINRWGLGSQVFPTDKFWVIVIWIFILGIFASFFAYVFLIAVAIFVDDADRLSVQEDSFTFSVFALVSVFWVGLALRAHRVGRLIQKARVLQGLSLDFHRWLSVSQIVGIYDGLAHAPSIVWDEFAGLNNFQLSSITTTY